VVLGVVWLAVGVLGIETVAGARASGLDIIAGMSEREGEALLDQARQAERRGDFGQADRFYRSAWSSRSTRHVAARELQRMHKRSGFRRLVDEEQVGEIEDALGSSFKRTETDHFVILSDADRRWTRERARLLERTALQFGRVMDRISYPCVPPEKKLLCVFFEEHSDYRAFASSQDGVEAGWIAGYYTGLGNRAVFYDDRTGPSFQYALNQLNGHEGTVEQTRAQVVSLRRQKDIDGARVLATKADNLERELKRERKRLLDEVRESSESKAIHEALHLLAFNSGVQSRAREYPFWITEGMASSFETSNPNASFGPDRPTEYRENEFVRATDVGLFPLEEFVVMTSVPENDGDLADVLYAQAYSLFAYLYRYEKDALGGYLEDVWAEDTGVRSERAHRELFEKHFGRIEALEHRWTTRTNRLMALAND
jgi:hypothetical protein